MKVSELPYRRVTIEEVSGVLEDVLARIQKAADADAIFADSSAKGRLGVNAVKAGKHLYDHVISQHIGKYEMELRETHEKR